MEQKELKIVPPEGYEIDRENSTFECIKFKKKTIRWRDNPDAIISGYYILSSTVRLIDGTYNISENHNIFATEKQAKSALAMARISQIMANDKRFGGPITDEEWKNRMKHKFYIGRNSDGMYSYFEAFGFCSYHFLAFHTKEQRDLFLEENEDLVKDYLMID